ncbi:hypothetical protein ABZ816_11760 [Actinosynnema sp. NPDC047251]|uniref:Secreted protein n=1 Tax=Saccharothrix espanaensis (strain ATCC 51144 / DSM 44229 / JCM 9112 / NBRC 15066 / NRRL 15764) TaxID=1179773 RepID=K0KCK2_SACES|nr:hypothetical protein [Saccharothrix espanaensis]CCH35272.1 hypothetical protein BN6_80540 [Saccharothrix espanaensis DSM 44229]
MPRRYVLTTLTVAAALTSAFTAPATAARSGAWHADLSVVDADDVGVTSDGRSVRLDRSAPTPAGARVALRTGFLHLAPHHLDAPANTIAATVRGDIPTGAGITVDVRGALDDDHQRAGRSADGRLPEGEQAESERAGGGRWTEWVEAGVNAPAVLPAVVRTVQVRVNLTAADQSPAVDEVALTPSTGPSGRISIADGPGSTFRVFATREGLVGGTTANGHVIVDNDHFAALPSRRGLSTKDTGSYSVQVCAENGRCEWTPVWDVGPWNTRDDHWNPPDAREMWQDLPHGKPQAQAAYQDSYNDGKDQFGRRVANPAGIDLADGTFWHGLRLADNAWVTVTYLWTGSGPTAFVDTPHGTVTVRTGPSTEAPDVGAAADHAQVRIECRVTGQSVTGSQGTSDVWLRLAPDRYVERANLVDVPDVPAC